MHVLSQQHYWHNIFLYSTPPPPSRLSRAPKDLTHILRNVTEFPRYFSTLSPKSCNCSTTCTFLVSSSRIFWSQKYRSNSFNCKVSLSAMPYRTKPRQTNLMTFFEGDENYVPQKCSLKKLCPTEKLWNAKYLVSNEMECFCSQQIIVFGALPC